MEERPTQSRKGVKGQLPLAESRGSASGGVWGNAPTVSRATSPKGKSNKGAGSEASLPVTLRVLRRAPQAALLTNCAVSRQMGATELPAFQTELVFSASRGIRACGRESGALRSPPTPLRSAHPCFLVFIVAGDFASAEASRGRNENRRSLRSPPTPLRSAHLCFLVFIVAGGIAPAGATRGLCGRPLDPFGRHYRNEF